MIGSIYWCHLWDRVLLNPALENYIYTKRGKTGFCSVRQVTHAFPAVLERLQLPAFDMSKLVGTFVRHISPAEQVPRELKRHLFSIEEKILEQQAWERGSSLYPLLTSACAPPPSDSGGAPRIEADTVMDESPPVTSRKVRPRFSTALSNGCWPTFTKQKDCSWTACLTSGHLQVLWVRS